jgi:putative PIN family toxin of toxin-antitoxin system
VGPLARSVLRAVLDTSIIVRAYVTPRGQAARIVRYWIDGSYDLVISEIIIAEYRHSLNYPHIQRRHRFTPMDIGRELQFIHQRAIVVEPTETIDAVKNDESDNRFLECAVAGDADYIVSADNHLLTLGTYRGIEIVQPAEFLAVMGERP